MVIYKIETATLKNDSSKIYSNNSKKGIYQTILKLVDTLGIKISKNAKDLYIEKFETCAVQSHLDTKEKISKDEVLDFNEYLEKVKQHFGEDSKEFLIASLYNLNASPISLRSNGNGPTLFVTDEKL